MTDETTHGSEYHDPHGGHESSDMSFGVAVSFGVSLIITCVICALIVAGLFRVFGRTTLREVPGTNVAEGIDVAPMQAIRHPSIVQTYPLAPATQPRVGPGVQSNPPMDLAELLKQEHHILSTYAWVDRGNGVVRIPIARAMQMLLKQGLPARKNPPPSESPLYPEVSSSGRMMEQLVP